MTSLSWPQPVQGPAYARGFRIAATVLCVALLLYGLQLMLLQNQQSWSLLGAATLALVFTWYFMLRSVTTIDARGIRQSGLLEKKVDWEQVMYARVVGFGFSRRLMVRTIQGRFKFFYGGSAELLQAFGRVAEAYPKPTLQRG